MKHTLQLLAIALILLSACDDRPDSDGHQHDHGETVTVTRWTDSLEVFLEYEAQPHTGSTKVLVHLTRLRDWSPVREGAVVLYATGPDGTLRGSASDSALQPGIYSLRLALPMEGSYEMKLVYRHGTLSDTCVLPAIVVADSHGDGEHGDDGYGETDPHSDSYISFLKEQQWSAAFSTAPASLRPVRASISASAEIQAPPGSVVEISAPVNGTILSRPAHGIPSLGSRIAKGRILAELSPDPGNVNGLAQVRAEYLDAKADFERVQRLHSGGAVSEKRLENARHRFDAARAGYEMLRESPSYSSGASDATLLIRAPVGGFLESVGFRPGQHIIAGQPLFVIADPSRLVLSAAVPVAHAAELDSITDAWFRVEGFETPFRVSALGGRMLSRGNVIDTQTRTLRVNFEFANPGNALAIGLFADVRLETGGARDVLAVPRQAVIDEGDGVHVIYVQRSGESFERRMVTLGPYGERFVEIRDGLRAGERVVTRGAQLVRLASLAGSIPEHGHSH